MVIVDLQTILKAEPCIGTGKLRVWGDVEENGEDELVWELENCGNGRGWVSIPSEEPMEEIVLRLVWGAGDRGFLTRPYASLANLAKDVVV